MKKLFFILSVLAFGIIVFIKVQNSASISMSDVALANIEALASGESGSTLKCYKTVSTNGSGQLTHVTYCGDCKAVKANAWSNEWQCR